MADILIRGMEMPQRCKACRFCGFGGRMSELNVCMFTGESQPKLSQERMSKCPLVPLPEGHGRLGDLDRLFEVMGQDADRWIVDEVSMIETDDVLYAIQNAPTIVPAEGGTDNG